VARVFIDGAHNILKPGGRLVLVANRFIRYDQVIREVFGGVERLAETSKYWVLSAT
jgi:16S rRNA (guanine1207-N2)-methyltransferase